MQEFEKEERTAEETEEEKSNETWREHAQKSLWLLLTIGAAILLYYLVQSLGAISAFVKTVLSGLSPVIWGLVLAYLLAPVARFYERNIIAVITRYKPLKHPKRVHVISSLLMALSAIGFITVLMLLIVPEISNSISGIVKELPSQVDRLMVQLRSRTFFDNESTIGAYANEMIISGLESVEELLLSELPKQAQKIGTYFYTGVKGVFSVIYNLVIGLILSVYITIDRDKLQRQIKQLMFTILPTRTALNTCGMLHRGNRKLSAAIHGKILDSFIIGMIHFFLLSIANLLPWFNYPYPVLLAVIVGVTNVVPFFGPIVGGFITGLLVLFENPSMTIPYVIIIVALQQFDSSFLDPHIVGSKIGLRPFWSIFGCLLGSAVLGVPGFVLGPPVTAFVYEIISDWTDTTLRKKHLERQLGLRPKEEVQREEMQKEEPIPEIIRFVNFIRVARQRISSGIEKLRNDK